MPYLTPDEIPEDDVCRPLFIPASTEWLAIVSGALTELTQTYNWEQEGAVTVEEAVERMQAMIDQYYDDACGTCRLPGDEPIVGLDLEGLWRELVNGEWVDPTGDYTVPAVPAREEPTSEERRCLAAANATNVLAQLYEQALDDYESAVDPIIALTGFASETVSAVGLAIGLLTKAFLGIVTGLWGVFYAAMEFLTTDVWDEEFTQEMQCILYECSADAAGVVTFDYNCVLDKLRFRVDISEPDFSSIRIFAQVAYILNFIGAQGLNLAGATTAIEEAGCDCEESCLEGIYILNGNGYPSPWNIRTVPNQWTCAPNCCYHDALSDSIVGCFSTVNTNNMYAEASYPANFPFIVASVHFVYEAISSRAGVGTSYELYDRMNTTPRLRASGSVTQTAPSSPLAGSVTFGTPIETDGHVMFRIRAGANAGAGTAVLHSLTLCPVE